MRLDVGASHGFRKEGQRNYWLDGVVPLYETEGNGNFSLPLAAIEIIEVKHRKEEDCIWTTGKYRIIERCKENRFYFNGMLYIPKGIKFK